MTMLEEPATPPAAARPADQSEPPVRRLLAAVERNPDLAAHRATCAAPPAPAFPRPDLISLVEQGGLRGRGGAAFPTAIKLSAVLRSAAASGLRPRVIINGTEGEPLSAKDEVLLSGAPHLVLDGAAWAAAAVAADQVLVAVDRVRSHAMLALDGARRQRTAAGEASPAVQLRPAPSRYVAGEETALVRFLNGGPAKPPGSGPKPFERGVDGRPTLVLNVETAAHLAQIMQFGPARFRQAGTPAHSGTALATVSGAVARPGVVEAPLGSPLATLADLAGGLTARPQAVLLGGYYGAWLPADATAGVGWSDEQLQPWGARVGCGTVAIFPQDRCGLREVSRVLTWLAGQSAGQCGPCVHGLGSIAAGMQELAEGHADPTVVDRLRRWSAQVEGRGACRFPDGAVRFLRTALAVFAEDVHRHQHGLACSPPSGDRYLLPIPDNGTEPWQ